MGGRIALELFLITSGIAILATAVYDIVIGMPQSSIDIGCKFKCTYSGGGFSSEVLILLSGGIVGLLAGIFLRRARMNAIERANFGGRRISGRLGEVGEMDFDIPPTSEAPRALAKQNGSEKVESSADANFKNPFDF